MPQAVLRRLSRMPTPMAGLALGVASLGMAWQCVFPQSEWVQWGSAILASVILLGLLVKFMVYPKLLWADLAHPVVGSVVPTYAMALMVISASVGAYSAGLQRDLWCCAIGLHGLFLLSFLWHRLPAMKLHHLVPSWFVPPIGMSVAALTCPSQEWLPIATAIMWFGLISYSVLLPTMLYRLIFLECVTEQAKPTLAILAAPASLLLAAYLSVAESPSPLLVALLFGIAVLMTTLIYLSFFHLLRLPFSPSYAAFTFPMVISATALFKAQVVFEVWGMDEHYLTQLTRLATLELCLATLVVLYVLFCYVLRYTMRPINAAFA